MTPEPVFAKYRGNTAQDKHRRFGKSPFAGIRFGFRDKYPNPNIINQDILYHTIQGLSMTNNNIC